MTTYRVELAFNTAQGPVASIYDYHLYGLQQGLVDVDAQPPRAQWYTKMQAGDTLRFTLFDISPEPGAFAPQLLLVDFRDPTSPQGLGRNPFSGVLLPLRFEAARLQGDGRGVSTVFGNAPSWRILDAAGAEAVYTFDNLGAFLMNARLTVADGDGRERLFAFDPEVIVGPNEPPGR